MSHSLADDLRVLGPRAKTDTLSILASHAEILDHYEINTPLRRCHFWAQAAHESGGFKFMHEVWGPTDVQKRYEGRKDLGNTKTGDGYLFRGRGIFQLTGRANYLDMGKKLGIDLVGDPELAAQPDIALEIACMYWKSRKLNVPADADDVVGVTKKINGGTNGLQDRKANLATAKKLWLHDEEAPPAPVKTMAESKQGNGAIAVGALGSVGAAKEVVSQVQEANDLFGTVMGLLKSEQFLIMVAVVGIGAAIWYWRKQHLEEHGV